METFRALPDRTSLVAEPLPEEPVASAWRVRVRMDDRPGTLARIAIRLADLECNILGLTVLPVPGGVLDEIVLRPATGLPKELLAVAIRDEGCECSGIVDADVRELRDTASFALSAARRAVDAPDRLAEVLREVLAADLVTCVPAPEGNPGRTESGHRAVFPLDAATVLVARRRWSPFVELELTRASALITLLAAARHNLSGAVALDRPDGAAVVLRPGTPRDADAVSDLHQRCSKETLFRRYHTGVRTVPRRWLHKLLMPPRGSSVLAVHGREVVGLGQLIPQPDGTAEVSLLVEDAWQGDGIGTALLARLVALAVAAGHPELTAVCLPGDDTMSRTAARAGLRTERSTTDSSDLRLFLP